MRFRSRVKFFLLKTIHLFTRRRRSRTMSGHNHCDGGHCDHDHSNDITPATQTRLYSQIDFDKIVTLNGTRVPAQYETAYDGILNAT